MDVKHHRPSIPNPFCSWTSSVVAPVAPLILCTTTNLSRLDAPVGSVLVGSLAVVAPCYPLTVPVGCGHQETVVAPPIPSTTSDLSRASTDLTCRRFIRVGSGAHPGRQGSCYTLIPSFSRHASQQEQTMSPVKLGNSSKVPPIPIRTDRRLVSAPRVQWCALPAPVSA